MGQRDLDVLSHFLSTVLNFIVGLVILPGFPHFRTEQYAPKVAQQGCHGSH